VPALSLSYCWLYILALTDQNKTRTRLFNQLQAVQTPAERDSIVMQIQEQIPGADNKIRESILQRVGPAGNEYVSGLLKAVKKERKSILGASALRSFGFILAAIAILLLFLQLRFNPLIAAILMTVAVAGDQLSFGKKYLDEDNYATKEQMNRLLNPATMEDLRDYEQNTFDMMLENMRQQNPDAQEQQLVQYCRSQAKGQALYYEVLIKAKQLYKDNNFRVHNLMDDPWNKSTGAYYVPMIGGYHPAKIGRYDDLITYQLGSGNPAVLDMLNAKYILMRNDSTDIPQMIDRGTNLGNCWFVREIQTVKNDTREMLALNNFNPRQTVVINDSMQPMATKVVPQFDSSATIKQTIFDNDHITYESNAATQQFAVFSEIYYSRGWKAYIDGNEVPYYRVNYTLRGLPVPAGKHKIEFIFKPASIKTSFMVATLFGNLILVLLAGAAWWQYRRKPAIKPAVDVKA
jgi:hypothetical protein